MNLEDMKIKPVTLAAWFALMPWVVANMYLTLIVNWPGVSEKLHTLNLEDMGRIANLNFFFCLYALGVVAVLITDRYLKLGSILTHSFLIFGFLVGIGIVYAVAYALRGVVSHFINGAIILDTIIAIYGLFMFYVDVITKWRHRDTEDKSYSRISTY